MYDKETFEQSFGELIANFDIRKGDIFELANTVIGINKDMLPVVIYFIIIKQMSVIIDKYSATVSEDVEKAMDILQDNSGVLNKIMGVIAFNNPMLQEAIIKMQEQS